MFGIDDILIGSAIAAVGGLVGNWMSGSSAASATRDANKTNMQIAKQNQDFQERMSSTAYERSVLDAEKAGLNPYITMTRGAASSPSGTTGAAQLPSNPDYGRGVSSAAQAFSNYFDLKSKDLSLRKMQSDIAVNSASAHQILTETRKTAASIPMAERDRDIEMSTFGTIMSYVNRVLSPVGSALSAATSVGKIGKLIHGTRSVSDFINGNTGVVSTRRTHTK